MDGISITRSLLLGVEGKQFGRYSDERGGAISWNKTCSSCSYITCSLRDVTYLATFKHLTFDCKMSLTVLERKLLPIYGRTTASDCESIYHKHVAWGSSHRWSGVLSAFNSLGLMICRYRLPV